MNSANSQNTETPATCVDTFQVTQWKFPKGFELDTKQEWIKIWRNTFYSWAIIVWEQIQRVLVTKTGKFLSISDKKIKFASLYNYAFIEWAIFIQMVSPNWDLENISIDSKWVILRTTEWYKIINFPDRDNKSRRVEIDDGKTESRIVSLNDDNTIRQTAEWFDILMLHNTYKIFWRNLAQATIRNSEGKIVELMLDMKDKSIAKTNDWRTMSYFYSSWHEWLYDGTVYNKKWEIEEVCLQEDWSLAYTNSWEDILTLWNAEFNWIKIWLESKIRGENGLIREVYLDKNREPIKTELWEEITDIRPNNNGYSYKTISWEFWKNDKDFLFMLSNVLRLIHETAEKTEQLVENK